MTRIRVNPAILNQSAGGVATIANQIHKIGEDVWRNASGAPSYDGQFGPKLRSIGQNAMAQAQRHSSRMSGLSGSLGKRASAFLAADAAVGKGTQVKISANILNNPIYLRLIATLLGLSIAEIIRLICLGSLRPPFGRFPWSILPPIKIIPQLPIPPVVPIRPVPTPTPPVVPTPKPPLPPVSPPKSKSSVKPVEPIGLSQSDKRWKDEPMGQNNVTIGEVGCLITSIAMIARSLGVDVTPSDVNKYLRENGGYSPGTSYLVFGVAEKFLESVTGKSMSHQEITSANVKNMINEGNPVIIHVKGNTTDGHWVVATSVDSNGNFVVYESGTGKQSTYSPDKLLSGHRVFAINK